MLAEQKKALEEQQMRNMAACKEAFEIQVYDSAAHQLVVRK